MGGVNKSTRINLSLCPVQYNFRFSYFGRNDQKRKNQLHCLCLKVTADFRNFVAKTDEKQKTKDEMNQTLCSKKEKGENLGLINVSKSLFLPLLLL